MKKLVLILTAGLCLCGALSAGEVELEISTKAQTCGEAGVQSYKACISKTEEDIYRVLEIGVEFLSQKKVGELCVVTSKCSFYQIIN
jgi:DNA integrity scanning protein DisA with diadenylate cyclase activity